VPDYPEEVYEIMNNDFKSIQKIIEDKRHMSKDELKNIDFQIREIFLNSMVTMIGGYKKYTSYIDQIPLFNLNFFVQNKNEKEKQFFTDFCQTQNFRHFLQSSHTNEVGFFEKIVSESKEIFAPRRGSLIMQQIPMNVEKSPRGSSHRGSKVKQSMPNIAAGLKLKLGGLLRSDSPRKAPIAKQDLKCLNIKYEYYTLFPFFLNKEFINCNKNTIEVEILKKYRYINDSYDSKIFFDHDILLIPEQIAQKHNEMEIRKYNIVPRSPELNNSNSLNNNLSTNVHRHSLKNKQLDFQKSISDMLNKKKKTFMETISEDIKEIEKPFVGRSVKKKKSLLTTILITKNQKELEMFQEQISEMIKDHMGLILTSTPLIMENKNEMQTLFYSKFARLKFAEILYQEKFKRNERHFLNEESFNDLYQMIFTALLHCQSFATQYEEVRLITKSSFFYYKQDKHMHNYFIFQEIAKKQGAFSTWMDEDFWRFYVDMEIVEFENKFDNVDDFYFAVILSVASSMNDLKIEKKFIVPCLIDKIAKNYFIENVL
jgi:hypothetical protein